MNVTWFKRICARYRRYVLWAGTVFIVYSLIGWVVVPLILKSQLEKRLPELTKRTARVRQVRFNPWALSLSIRGLSLREADEALFASWEEFYVNFQASSLLRWAWTFDEIRLVSPSGHIVLLKDGSFNFANLLPPTPVEKKPEVERPAGFPRIRVFTLVVTNGLVSFDDQTHRHRFETEYRPINIRLADVSTRAGDSSPYSFKAENDSGKRLVWSGDVSLRPFGSHGHVVVTSASPGKYSPYLEDFTSAQIRSGRANLTADYFAGITTNGLELVVSNASFQLMELVVRDPSTAEDFFELPALSVENASLNLRERRAAAETIKISGPKLVARVNHDRSLNLQKLIVSRETAPAPVTNAPVLRAEEPWSFSLGKLALESAAVVFEDLAHKQPFRTEVTNISCTLEHFTTRRDSDAGFRFGLTSELGEKISGEGTLSVNPVRSGGVVSVSQVALKKYMAYLETAFNGRISDGRLSAHVPYQCAIRDGAIDAALTNSALTLTGFEFQSNDEGEPVLTVPELSVDVAQASLNDRSAIVRSVRSMKGQLNLQRNTKGLLNLVELFAVGGQTNSSSGKDPAEKAASWSVLLEQVGIQDYGIHVRDEVPIPAVEVRFAGLSLEVNGLSTASNAPVEILFSTLVNEQGGIALKANGTLRPLAAKAQVGITNLPVGIIHPYTLQYARVADLSAALDADAAVSCDISQTQKMELDLKGNLSIRDLHTSDGLMNRELLCWTNLSLTGIGVSAWPPKVEVERVGLDGLRACVWLDTNKVSNLEFVLSQPTNSTAMAPKPSETTSPSSPQASSTLKLPLSIALVTVSNSAISFVDGSITPSFEFAIRELGGVLKGLSTTSVAPAHLEFGGALGQQAPFTLSGEMRPFGESLSLNLSFSNRNTQVPVFTPYMSKYAGYPLNKGRLGMQLQYEIEDKALKAQNRFEIDQLMLGAPSGSPDATKLPVKLAIALLKDRNGKIELDVPVEGKLDDPEFRVGRVILKVVANVITKAATSPFKLLGSLVGGGEELSFLEFQPGTTILLGGETNKLAKLLKALEERPAINLEISGSADLARDSEALALESVRARIRTDRLKELAGEGQPAVDPAKFEMAAADYERLLHAALIRQYGTNLQQALEAFSATVTNETALTTKGDAAEPQKGGLWGRIAARWPFQSKDSPAAQARRRARQDERLVKNNPALVELAPSALERLLASTFTIGPEQLRELSFARVKAVQQQLLERGLTAERIFITEPDAKAALTTAGARANLSLN
jgi:hypothetical protein